MTEHAAWALFFAALCWTYASSSCASSQPGHQTDDATSLLQTYIKSNGREGGPPSSETSAAAGEMKTPVPGPQMRDKRVDPFTLPRFETSSELAQPENAKWFKYLHALYGPAVFSESTFPLDTSQFYILNTTLLSAAGLHPRVMKCPKEELDIFSEWLLSPVDFWHVYHETNHGLPDDSWVEVTHCNNPPNWLEKIGYWLYYAPGSGIFVNIGKTKVFKDHGDAVAEFLPGTVCKNFECDKHYAELTIAAAKYYNTLQFVDHRDQECITGRGKDRYNLGAHEILALHESGDKTRDIAFSGAFGYCSCAPMAKTSAHFMAGEQTASCLTCQLDCTVPGWRADKKEQEPEPREVGGEGPEGGDSSLDDGLPDARNMGGQ